MIGRRRVAAGAALALLAALSPAHGEILIATSGPMKGQHAVFGEQMRAGAEAAVKSINDAGGLLGEQVKLEALDDACDARRAAEIAKDLAGRKVALMAGPFCSIAAIAVAPGLAEAGVVMISPSASNPGYLGAGLWNTFGLAPSDEAQGAFTGLRLAKEFAGKRIVIVHDGTPHASGIAAAMKAAMNGARLKETAVETYEAGKADLPALALKIKLAAPDALYLSGGAVDVGNLLKALRAAGVTAPAFGPDTLAIADLWTAAETSAEGLEVTFPPDPQRQPAAAKAIAAYAAASITPEGPTLPTQAAVELWAAAVTATGGTDGRRVAEWLRAGNPVKTVVGEITLNAKGAPKDAPFLWLKWSNGAIAEVR